jgi:hypothetical protein
MMHLHAVDNLIRYRPILIGERDDAGLSAIGDDLNDRD